MTTTYELIKSSSKTDNTYYNGTHKSTERRPLTYIRKDNFIWILTLTTRTLYV